MAASTYVPCESCAKVNRVSLSQTANKEPVCGHCGKPLPLHGAVVEAGAPGLKALVEKTALPVICDFWSPWCGPCQAFAPTFNEVAKRFAGRATFVKLNTELQPMGAAAHGVKSIPTLILFRYGREVNRLSGAQSASAFSDWLERHLPQANAA